MTLKYLGLDSRKNIYPPPTPLFREPSFFLITVTDKRDKYPDEVWIDGLDAMENFMVSTINRYCRMNPGYTGKVSVFAVDYDRTVRAITRDCSGDEYTYAETESPYTTSVPDFIRHEGIGRYAVLVHFADDDWEVLP